MNKLNHLIFTSIYITLWKDHIFSWSINMGLNIASLPYPLSLFSIEMLDFLQLSIICTRYIVPQRPFLVSRNYYIKQMSNINKMAFSQPPYQKCKASCGHVQRLNSSEDVACFPSAQDVVQEAWFCHRSPKLPKGHWLKCKRGPFSIKTQTALEGRGLNSQL